MELKIAPRQIHFNIINNIHDAEPIGADTKKSNGIGLKNIRERLELLYENKYELQISTDNNIFEAKLNIQR